MNHPAVDRVLERIRGVEWHYGMFDYGAQIGVCGSTSDGRRCATRFVVTDKMRMPDGSRPRLFPTDYLVACKDKIDEAKAVVMTSLFDTGEGVRHGDETVEGGEIQI